MERDLNQWTPAQGMTVLGSDNEKVGEVDTVEQNHFVVRKGFFFPEDHYIPIDAVSSYDDENVYLSVTKDQALEQQWGAPPADGYDTTTTATDEERIAVDTAATTGQGATAATSADARGTLDDDFDDRDRVGAGADNRDSINVPIHEEELTARRREVDRGNVIVSKNVVEEEQSIDVPVTEERVQVSRRDVDREALPGEAAFEEGTIEVPVRGEEVEVEKRTRVTGEVDIDKTAEERTEHVRDTVRREEVSIEGEEVTDERRDRSR